MSSKIWDMIWLTGAFKHRLKNQNMGGKFTYIESIKKIKMFFYNDLASLKNIA